MGFKGFKIIKSFLLLFSFLQIHSPDTSLCVNVINDNFDALYQTKFSGFTSACLIIYKDGNFESGFFQISDPKNGIFFIDNDNFIRGSFKHLYPLVNFSTPFIQIKDNAITFVHPIFLVKFLHIVSEMNFNQRITDALRNADDQERYKRKGWTGSDKSPHMVGLAVDIGSYNFAESKQISELCSLLNLRFLEHGAGANRHIHIQDNSIWEKLNQSYIKQISHKFNSDADIDKFCRIASFNKLENDALKFSEAFNITGMGLNTLRVEYSDVMGIVHATFFAGVIEGDSRIYFNPSFLPKGIYRVEIFNNEIETGSKIIAIN